MSGEGAVIPGTGIQLDPQTYATLAAEMEPMAELIQRIYSLLDSQAAQSATSWSGSAATAFVGTQGAANDSLKNLKDFIEGLQVIVHSTTQKQLNTDEEGAADVKRMGAQEQLGSSPLYGMA